jgi:hypothetical protein
MYGDEEEVCGSQKEDASKESGSKEGCGEEASRKEDCDEALDKTGMAQAECSSR